ncbi:MAG: UvrB/UvrC motif-containing protein [Clostridia bacterium]|nr:UvrB/UvrC motif-containing protein [Clostridia bacterium]
MSEHENAPVLCEECGVNEACYTISVMMNGQVTQRRLCADCMAKMNMNLAAGNVKHLLSAIMSAITGGVEAAAAAAVAPEDDVVCERCGTTLSQFTKSGKLGCPTCYTAFREQLTPMLQQIHGRTQHAGRKPLDTEAAQRRRAAWERLSRQLEQAVAVEDFESAAQLRDQLRRLQTEGGED